MGKVGKFVRRGSTGSQPKWEKPCVNIRTTGAGRVVLREERKSCKEAETTLSHVVRRCLCRRFIPPANTTYAAKCIPTTTTSSAPQINFSSQEQTNPRRLVADISRAAVHGAKDLEVLGRHSAGTRTSRAQRRGPLILVFEARVLCALAVFVAFLAVDLFCYFHR